MKRKPFILLCETKNQGSYTFTVSSSICTMKKARERTLLLLWFLTNHLTEVEGTHWNRTVTRLSFADGLNKTSLRLFCIYSTFNLKASKCFVSSDGQQGFMLILSALIINFHRPGSGSLAWGSEGGARQRWPDAELASRRTRPFACHPVLSAQTLSGSPRQAGTHFSPCQGEPPQPWYLERYCEGWLRGI